MVIMRQKKIASDAKIPQEGILRKYNWQQIPIYI